MTSVSEYWADKRMEKIRGLEKELEESRSLNREMSQTIKSLLAALGSKETDEDIDRMYEGAGDE